MSTDELYMVITTADSENVAQSIAKTLTEQRVAACVQVSGPVTSYYWWQESMEKTTEWRIVLKTSRSPEEVENAIRKIHPYTVPQIIFVPVSASTDYARWVREVLS